MEIHMNMKLKSSLVSALLSSALLLTACSKPAPDNTQSTEERNANEVIDEPQAIIPKKDYLTRDIKEEVFYFVMPDRFHNANTENDNGDPNKPISYGGLDPTSKWAFHGGDIAGLEAKLDYLEEMGVTSIWMTPILRNKAVQPDGFGHHGYWVVDFTEIDPHFGSNDDLKSLIAAAHERHIKIFFDIITNHTADVIKYKECHDQEGNFLNPDQKGCPFISTEEMKGGKGYTPFVLETEKNVKVPSWLNDPKYYNNQGDSFWEGESAVKGDFVGLDDLDTSQPEVINGLTEVFKDLISEFRPDGFRIDTVKHVDIEFWQSFGPAIVEHAISIGLPEFFIFGEVYDGSPAGLSKFTTTGKLPSVLDFGFAFNVRDVVLSNKNVSKLSTLFDNDDYYRDGDSDPNDLLNFIGNHDMGRVGNAINNGLPNISDEEKLARSKLSHALMFFSRGVPVVYYGDEQGFTGDGGDVDSRENMDPSLVDSYNDNDLIGTEKTTADSNFDRSHPLYVKLQELALIRQTYPSLKHGEHINRLADDSKQIYAFSRVSAENQVDHMAIFNFSTKRQQLSTSVGNLTYKKIAGSDDSSLSQSGDQLQLELAPLSYVLLQSTQPIAQSRIRDIMLRDSYRNDGRVFLPVNLGFSNPEQFNLARVEFYDVSEPNKRELIAFDTTAPYRAVLTPEIAKEITKIEIQADNFSGQTLSKSFELMSSN